MWFINTPHKWIIVLNGRDNPRDGPHTWLVEEFGGVCCCSGLDASIRASQTCTCRVSVSVRHKHFFWVHTHTHTRIDLNLWRHGWWGLGEKRQSSVPWCWSSGSGQDSARCNPSQVMLFAFSRFQLICLNAPSSPPPRKSTPAPPQPSL